MANTEEVPPPLGGQIRPTRAEVDLGALGDNLAVVRRLTGPTVGTLAVVKANAYGHGAVPVARLLEARGIELLGVALVEEGVELRQAGIRAPILVLGGSYGGSDPGGYESLLRYDLVPIVFRSEHLTGLAEAAAKTGRPARAHLKVDTGLGRLGVQLEGLGALLAQWRRHPSVELEGLLSHFSSADLANAAQTSQQVASFRTALEQVRAAGFAPRYRHLANSAGLIDRPEVREGTELNLVRPGLMLYGYPPAEWMGPRVALRPLLRWTTAIVHLKQVPPGAAISYGGTWTAKQESLIATLPVGYADGYDRQYSNRAEVLVGGRRVPVVGRVCMDLCMVDVTEVPGVQLGDEAVLIGSQGSESIGADELAGLSGTIPYEVLCAIGARVPRIAVRG